MLHHACDDKWFMFLICSAVTIDVRPATFEFVAARVVACHYTCTVITVYRPGSEAVSMAFFDELAELLDQVATLSEPIHVTGDFNVRLERADDVNASRLIDLLAGYGLDVHVTTPTHRMSGTLHLSLIHI